MEAKTHDFEAHLERSKTILETLMDPELTLEASIKAYEEGMKELEAAQKMLEEARLKVEEIKKRGDD